MGVKCCSESKSKDLLGEVVNKTNFIKKYPIGKGGFGRVSFRNKIIYFRFGKFNINIIKKCTQ